MKPIPAYLKLKLIILAFIFPISFALAGIIIGNNIQLFDIAVNSNYAPSIFGGIGFLLGTILNLICYYRKLFAIAIYQTPIPLALFFAFRWVTNIFLAELAADAIALVGLLIGLWLNKELVLPYQFYKVPKRILATLYLFYSIVALGFFLGVPIFNILLGMFAGNYLAVRIISYGNNENHKKNINQGSMFSAIIILIVSIFAGLIAMNDIDSYVQLISQLVHIQINPDQFLSLFLFTITLTTIVQYFITRFTAYTMLDLFSHRKSH